MDQNKIRADDTLADKHFRETGEYSPLLEEPGNIGDSKEERKSVFQKDVKSGRIYAATEHPTSMRPLITDAPVESSKDNEDQFGG